jgi:hypothetical protein
VDHRLDTECPDTDEDANERRAFSLRTITVPPEVIFGTVRSRPNGFVCSRIRLGTFDALSETP